MLNLSIMFDRPCAVHCAGYEQAEALVEAIRATYPEKAGPWENIDDYNWYSYESETCYTLHNDDYNGGLVVDRLYYCYKSYYEENGYEIVEFDELLLDDVELQESDMPLEEFLGI